ncbi:Uncharacterized protein Rs2_38585 [Raphanus sativus]|nr:Uncharacterized protein Rs2_38585 [Raphanus sativus]
MARKIRLYDSQEGTHSAHVEGDRNVLQAQKLPLERRCVTYLLRLEVLRRRKLWGYSSSDGVREGDSDDPMIAFKKATDAISARKDSSSRNVSGDGTTAAGNKRRMIRRSDDTSPSQGGHSLDKDSSGINQQVQGEFLQVLSHLHHLKDQLAEEGLSVNRGEITELSRYLSEEKSRRVVKELEFRDLQAKVRAIEGSVETVSAESLQLSGEIQELEETIVEL